MTDLQQNWDPNNTGWQIPICKYSKLDDKCAPSWFLIILNLVGGLTVILNIMHLVVIRSSTRLRKSANAKGLLNLAAIDIANGLEIVITTNCFFANAVLESQSLTLCVGTLTTNSGLLSLQTAIFSLACLERCMIISRPKIKSKNTNGFFKALFLLVWICGLGICLGVTWSNIKAQISGNGVTYCFYGVGGCRYARGPTGYKQAFIASFFITFFVLMAVITLVIIGAKVIQSRSEAPSAKRVSARNVEIASMLGALGISEVMCWILLIAFMITCKLKPDLQDEVYPYVQVCRGILGLSKPIACFASTQGYRLAVINLIQRGLSKAAEPSVLSTYSSGAMPSEAHTPPVQDAEVRSVKNADKRALCKDGPENGVKNRRCVNDEQGYHNEVMNNLDELTLNLDNATGAKTGIIASITAKGKEIASDDSTTDSNDSQPDISDNRDNGIIDCCDVSKLRMVDMGCGEPSTAKDDQSCGKIGNVTGEYDVEVLINIKDETTAL